MEKKLPILLTALLLISFFVAPATFAQDENDATAVETTMGVDKVDSTKITVEERKATREAKMEEVKQKREDRKAEIGAKREEAKQKREDLKAEIKAKREEAKAAVAAKREEFRTKLKAIKDKRKASIVERVDTRLSERNDRITDRLLGHLERISGIIDKMEDKIANVPEGDTTDVDAAIASARDAVAAAEDAVSAQSGHTYVIELGAEDELRTVVQATVDEFRTDMKTAITAVKDARDATQDAAKALAAFRKANPPKEDTVMEK